MEAKKHTITHSQLDRLSAMPVSASTTAKPSISHTHPFPGIATYFCGCGYVGWPAAAEARAEGRDVP